MESVESILKELLNALGIPSPSVSRSELAGQVIFSIELPDESSTFLGNHSDTLHALDYLVKKIAEKRAAPPKLAPEGAEHPAHAMFLVDINGHRARQIRDLQSKAIMMAERARSFQYDVELTPMSSYERLIIHATLQGAPNVKTESQGEGRDRRVVIKYSA